MARGVIADIFEGSLLSMVRCKTCHKESITVDKFYDLSVQIDRRNSPQEKSEPRAPSKFRAGFAAIGALGTAVGRAFGLNSKPVQLSECLQSFCAMEELLGTERYLCEACKTLNESQKELRIARLPEILCIHLKRFRYDSYFSSKLSTHVLFPITDLDLKPFCTSELATKSPVGGYLYELCAVVTHRGSLGGGHYVAYAKNRYDREWYEFDDTRVTRKSEQEVSAAEAYLLFYQRTLPGKIEERERILQKIETAVLGRFCFVPALVLWLYLSSTPSSRMYS